MQAEMSEQHEQGTASGSWSWIHSKIGRGIRPFFGKVERKLIVDFCVSYEHRRVMI